MSISILSNQISTNYIIIYRIISAIADRPKCLQRMHKTCTHQFPNAASFFLYIHIATKVQHVVRFHCQTSMFDNTFPISNTIGIVFECYTTKDKRLMHFVCKKNVYFFFLLKLISQAGR